MRDQRFIYVIAIAAAVLLGLVTYFSDGEKKEKNDWTENYLENSREPYGTRFLYRLMEDYFPDYKLNRIDKKIAKALPEELEHPANYIFIGNAAYIDSTDADALLDFVDAGGNAFFSSKTIPDVLMEQLYEDDCNYTYWDDYEISYFRKEIKANFIHPNIQRDSAYIIHSNYKNKPSTYNFHYIDSIYFCDMTGGFTGLAYADDVDGFHYAKLEYGDGNFLFHTLPIAFTNIQLLKKDGVDYISKVFSHLNEGDIYWDAHSQTSEMLGRSRNYSGQHNRAQRESPLKYILAQGPLAWAWYLTLLMGVLFLIFRAKRTQQIIPVTTPNKNTSLEFISTIGKLYFIQNNHRDLCLEKMKLFQAHVRDRYSLSTKDMDPSFVSNLSKRSEIPKEAIQKIITYHQNLSNSIHVSEKTMVDFHLLLAQYYEQCK